MNKYFRSKLLDKNAQDMIEFTLVLPILMFVFLFILTGGQMIYNKQVAFNMAYQSCRVAVTCQNKHEAKIKGAERAEDFLPQAIAISKDNAGNYIWDYECDLAEGSDTWSSFKRKDGAALGKSQFCEVKVTLHMNTLFPMKSIIDSKMPISAKTQMVIEYNPIVHYNKSKPAVSIR